MKEWHNALDEELFRLIKDNGVKEIKLDGKKIGDEGCTKLCNALAEAQNTSVTYLDLDNNGITDVGAEVVGNLLKRNRTITRVDLYDNKIGDEGCTKLCNALAEAENTSVTFLYLRSNGITDVGAEAVGNLLKRNRTITKVFLGHNKIGDEGCTKLCNALAAAENTSVTDLRLDNNGITDVGAEAVGNLLKRNRTITRVNLDGNAAIGDESKKAVQKLTRRNIVTAVIEKIKANTIGETIDLNGNKIGDEGCTKLCNALAAAENTSVTSLGLYKNGITDVGAEAVGNLLKRNRTIKTVDLGDNKIGDEGCTKVCNALADAENTSVTVLGYLGLDYKL